MSRARVEAAVEAITELKVGPCVYGVVRAPITQLGLCDYKNQTITLQPGMHPVSERLVIWHELIHAMMFQLGYNEHDEKLVDGLAHYVVSVLVDNPRLNGTGGQA
jgi:hypothetical protein